MAEHHEQEQTDDQGEPGVEEDPSRRRPPPTGALEREAAILDHPSEVIRSLARAARSFVTYDARNETVRRMLGDYRETVERALEKHGALEFEIQPFEMAWNGETVYSEIDRERSLAFRLFRDGVRSITLGTDVPWDELLRLLEVLSVRYVGIRQNEDDTLTLLRQAEFEKIEFTVVEAYVPAEENPEGALERQAYVHQALPPPDWDTPLPRLGGQGPLAYRDLTEEELAKVRAESTPGAMVAAAQQVVREMLSIARRASAEAITASVLTLIEEICRYMIVELRPKELVWVLREARSQLGDTPAVDEIAEKFGHGDVLDRFLRDPDDVKPDDLMPLFAVVGGDQLDRVIDRFTREEDPALRNALKTILARMAAGNPEALLNRLGEVPTNRVVDLFNVVCVVAPMERVVEAAYSLAQHPSPEVKLGAMEVLTGVKVDERFHETFQTLLASEAPRVRVKATNIYGKRGGSRAFTRLRDQLESLSKTCLDQVEAAALGQALMQSSPESARPLLRSLVKRSGMKGLVQRVKFGEGYGALRWAAVAGLAVDTSARSRAALEWLAEHSGKELRDFCRRSLEQMPRPGEAGERAETEDRGTKEGKEAKETGETKETRAAKEAKDRRERVGVPEVRKPRPTTGKIARWTARKDEDVDG
jgi:hypothetical protein